MAMRRILNTILSKLASMTMSIRRHKRMLAYQEELISPKNGRPFPKQLELTNCEKLSMFMDNVNNFPVGKSRMDYDVGLVGLPSQFMIV